MVIIHILYLKLTELKSKLFRSQIARKTAVEYKDRYDAKFAPPFIMTVSSQFTVLNEGYSFSINYQLELLPKRGQYVVVRHLALTSPSLRNQMPKAGSP